MSTLLLIKGCSLRKIVHSKLDISEEAQFYSLNRHGGMPCGHHLLSRESLTKTSLVSCIHEYDLYHFQR